MRLCRWDSAAPLLSSLLDVEEEVREVGGRGAEPLPVPAADGLFDPLAERDRFLAIFGTHAFQKPLAPLEQGAGLGDRHAPVAIATHVGIPDAGRGVSRWRLVEAPVLVVVLVELDVLPILRSLDEG